MHHPHKLREIDPGPATGEECSELISLRRQVEELHRAVRAREDFIAIAAHELRNPMTPIVGTAELALIAMQKAEVTFPPRIIALLERLQLQIQDYMKRATRLLDITRLESDNLVLEPIATDLSHLVRSVAQRYEAEATHRRSAIEHDIEDGISAVCDPLAVEQVVENLLSNALKFGAGKPVVLRLRSDGNAAALKVQDAGVGMSIDQQERIFGRFEQVVANHSGVGFGLGLWIASRLVAAMNGRISVSSRPGAGSVFTVMFPLSSANYGSGDA